MEYKHFTTFVKLSTVGVEDASSTLTEQDLDQAIERAAAERPEEWWERDGPVRRDGLNAEIPFRRPGSGELGGQQIRTLGYLLLVPPATGLVALGRAATDRYGSGRGASRLAAYLAAYGRRSRQRIQDCDGASELLTCGDVSMPE